MRTTVNENIGLGKVLAEKLNMASGKTVLMLPLKGVSGIDAPGEPFYGPEEDEALFDTVKANLNGSVEVIELDNNVNDDDFALAAAKKLIELIEN